MSFVLVSRTGGDELLKPVRSVVATSEDRRSIERLRGEREVERKAWLAENPLPWWVKASVIVSEDIEEVPGI